jgi:MFS family permease
MAASRREVSVVYLAGIVQGIVLVTFPAASTIFTDPDEYDLSNTRYGLLFVPQVLTAITASLLGSTLAHRFSTKRVYLAGLVAGLVAMALLLVSQFFESSSAAFPVLLVATAFLGVGFGLTVPALNTLTAAFHPQAVEKSVLVLNALLGLGTALAPVFVAVFVGLGFWWGLPLTSAILLAALTAVSVRLPLHADAPAQKEAGRARRGIPSRFWVFAAFAVLYGICETLNGNWSQLDMTSELGASTTEAAVALTAFWAMVTVGRVVFAAIERQVPSRVTYNVLPFLLAGTFVLIGFLPDGDVTLGVLAFAWRGSVLCAPSAHHRLRPRGARIDVGRRGRGSDRVLPGGIRPGSVRRRAIARPRRRTADGLQARRLRRSRNGPRVSGRHAAELRFEGCSPR